MTIHARSDIAAVTISAAHGGCGKTHARPAPGGNPVALWSLDCPACEDHLRSDGLWSSTVSEIPETHDEKLAREDFEKRGAKDKDAVMTLALARLAGIDPDLLPDSLVRMISGAKAHVPQTVACPQGHPNPADQKFCGECGLDVHGTTPPPLPAPADVLPPVNGDAPAPEPSPPPVALPSNTKMRAMKREDLDVLAAGAGVATGGSRQDVLDRLIAANNAVKDNGTV
jgi:hypothetical protein